MIKGLGFFELARAVARPTGLVMVVIVAGCVGAILLWVPPSQYALAGILGLGLIALLAVVSIHILALTRWTKLLEHGYEAQSLASQQLTQSIAKFEAYSDAADLNVGRIGMLQAQLERRIRELERRTEYVPQLEKGFDRAGVRMSKLESELERIASILNRFERELSRAKPKIARSVSSGER